AGEDVVLRASVGAKGLPTGDTDRQCPRRAQLPVRSHVNKVPESISDDFRLRSGVCTLADSSRRVEGYFQNVEPTPASCIRQPSGRVGFSYAGQMRLITCPYLPSGIATS